MLTLLLFFICVCVCACVLCLCVCYYYCIERCIYLNLIKSKRRRAESFEACCQRALLSVQITTLLFPFPVQKYVYPPVSKVHSGSHHVSVTTKLT